VISTQSVAPKDLDALLTVDEFLRWLGKEPDKKTRRWAEEQARNERVPSLKIGKLRLFHPRTVLAQCIKGVKP